jgi:hypothetical protein
MESKISLVSGDTGSRKEAPAYSEQLMELSNLVNNEWVIVCQYAGSAQGENELFYPVMAGSISGRLGPS